MRSIVLFAVVVGCSPAPVKTPPITAKDPSRFAGGSLPLAEHEGKGVPSDAPVITVAAGSVKVNELVADDVTSVNHDRQSKNLVGLLRDARKAWIDAHPGEPFPGLVVYRLDRTTPSRLVTRLAYSAALAGFPDGCVVAVDPRGNPVCIELGMEIPALPPNAPPAKKIHMLTVGADHLRFEKGLTVSLRELRATVASRDHAGYELVIEPRDDLDLQSLVAMAEVLGSLVPPAARVAITTP
jgi:hypothetical protein